VAKRGLGRSNVVAEINVTPMADVMLVLLIIFMITTPLLQSGITVNLPKAKNPLDAPDADSKEAVVLAVNREGKLYLAKKQIGRKICTIFFNRNFPVERSTGPFI
jgi:biopolymer transport protein TolR